MRDAELKKCHKCGKTFEVKEVYIACAVKHPLGECCHYGQTEVVGRKTAREWANDACKDYLQITDKPGAPPMPIKIEQVILAHTAQETEELRAEIATLRLEVGRKQVITGDTSDGYHTFNELYDHRVLLWINLCLLQHPKMVYLVENHFDGWFLLGVETPQGQLSYHCPNKYLHLVKTVERRHPEFDGHSSSDVLNRLEALAVQQALSPQPNLYVKVRALMEAAEPFVRDIDKVIQVSRAERKLDEALTALKESML